MINISLPDGSKRSFQDDQTYFDVAKDIGSGLAKAALAAKINGKVVDLHKELEEDGELSIITKSSEEALEIIRHTTAHVLAMAVQKLWPGTQVTIGPVIENGFYYDFAFLDDVKIGESDFAAIEKEMKNIIKKNHQVIRKVVSREEAIKIFSDLKEEYKVELIRELPEGEDISIYGMEEWFDLCRGPHVPSTSKLGAFKLMRISGSYWRGDEKKAMLTRIYGTAWKTKDELNHHLEMLEEAKKRDHRILGKQLDLFSFQPAAPANAFFHPKGAYVYNKLKDYMRKSNERFGFSELDTPLIMDVEMWKKSGHYENYRENMYFTNIDDREAAIKPMNCPGHCLVFGSKRRSYRDLPVRFSEFGRVHRHERSGVTHGLFRVRTFVQDDAHVFCTEDQISDEITKILEQIDETYKNLGFENFKMELSTRPEKSIGSDEVWQKAEAALESTLKKSGKEYRLNPGDGAFYGPKIDFHLIDSLGRSWQCGTVQLDFSMPVRFDLEYQDSNDQRQNPVMIHRAVLGSLERFMGIFIEHYAGKFPLWCTPEQVRVINISDKQLDYANEVVDQLKAQSIRVELDSRNEKLGFKIREAQIQKVPYMIVIGEKERESKTVSPRFRDGSQENEISIEQFYKSIQQKVADFI